VPATFADARQPESKSKIKSRIKKTIRIKIQIKRRNIAVTVH